MKKLNKKGFTLIEMLVVIAIIAILVAIIIPTVTNATEKARQATDVANIRGYIAELQIDTLTKQMNQSDAWTKLGLTRGSDPSSAVTTFGTKKSNQASYSASYANGILTVEYTATLLNDGMEATAVGGVKNKYKWTVGELYQEVTTTP